MSKSFSMEKIITKNGFEPILEKIFKHSDSATLMSCLSVCKYWNKVVQNPSFLLICLKLAKIPEDIFQKWKELAIMLQHKIVLSNHFSRCLLWTLKKCKDIGFISPETAASALGLVPLLEFTRMGPGFARPPARGVLAGSGTRCDRV